MKNKKVLAILFKKKPVQWGLRGDPYLWDDIAQTIGDLDFPYTEEQLISLLESTFEKLTGVSLSSKEDVYVEKYSHGGMSSGHVCLEFWKKRRDTDDCVSIFKI